MAEQEQIPAPGQWPVDPQDDQPILKERIWIDGCFDFSHHGHAGAMLQARQLGQELYVGVHSDEAILENKGPTVMSLQERIAAVDACRWVTKSVPHAPYVTSLAWISHYGCQSVVHGDDITSDSNGEDCYRHVKAAGRFLIVKRTPGISTTDLVGRMLLYTRTHFIKSLSDVLSGQEGAGSDAERRQLGSDMRQRIASYATDASGLQPGAEVWTWHSSSPAADVASLAADAGSFAQVVQGKPPQPDQRIFYVDGGFDLFSTGHIEFLRRVTQTEEERAQSQGWFDDAARQRRIANSGTDYGPLYLVAGVHDDEVINYWKGLNYPIMNIFERGLCVLQCKYVHAVIFSAPFKPHKSYLENLPYGLPAAVYHGPTAFMPVTVDAYADARQLGIFHSIAPHEFQHINAGEIVERIMKSRARYEERQRLKGEKAVGEEATRRREELERETAERQQAQRAAVAAS